MPDLLSAEGLGPEQQELWQKVNELWEESRKRDAVSIRSSLHPKYLGWDMGRDHLHDREEAVRSATGSAPRIIWYQLHPLGVEVFENKVGIVHYCYSANLSAEKSGPLVITGKWTEVYLRQGDKWTMISVSGRPDLLPLQ